MINERKKVFLFHTIQYIMDDYSVAAIFMPIAHFPNLPDFSSERDVM
jgi:hypothetical protein